MAEKRVIGIQYDIVRLLMLVNIWWVGVKVYKNPFKALKVVKILLGNFTKMMGNKKLVRAYKINGKYAWDIFNPSWPSKAFNSFFINHLNEIETISNSSTSLRRLVMAITKRCPLKCEHCSEAATLYNNDILTYGEFIGIIDPMVKLGVAQLIYSGGEPLSRFDDLIKFIGHYKDKCDQWIYSSGYGLTKEKALSLKRAGLNGAAISLDHHLESAHNLFRGNDKSYYWVLESIKNLKEAGVFVAINICPTKEYLNEFGMEPFIELAKKLNIAVINIFEPRAVGNYQAKDVELEKTHKTELVNICNKYNYSKKHIEYPTIIYPGSFRNEIACGGGMSYLFLDYDGNLYPCPFCKVPMPEAVSTEGLCVA